MQQTPAAPASRPARGASGRSAALAPALLPAGTLPMDGAGTEGSPWPLAPGKYVVYYLLADAYTAAAKASFTVSGP